MALTQVSTKGLKDGTILNADINASASIAGTKINPDFGSQNIASTGQLQVTSQIPASFKRSVTGSSPVTVLIGNDTQTYALAASSTGFTINDYTNINVPRLGINSSGNVFIGGSSSVGTKLHIENASGDAHIRLRGSANYGILFTRHSDAALTGYVGSGNAVNLGGSNVAVSASLSGGDIIFQTNGTAATDEKMRIASDGLVTVKGDLAVTSSLAKIKLNDTDGGDQFQIRNDTGTFMIRNSTDSKSVLKIDGACVTSILNPTAPATGTGVLFVSNNGSATTLGTAATCRIANNGGNSAYSVFEAESSSGSIRLANDGQFYVTGASTFNGDIRVDRGSTIDGIVGQAYSGYFGLKHTDQTINTEYMMISNNSHTYISCTSGYSIILRPSANSSVHETVFAHGNTTYKTNIVMDGHPLRRNQHQWGHLEGGQNNIGTTDQYTSPIYTIGSSYNPTDTALSNMYGIGFSHGNASFTPSGAGWGLYVAADGDARIFLDGSYGNIYLNATGSQGAVIFANGGWSGESSTGKIQTHGTNMYLQHAGGSWIFRKTNGVTAAQITSAGVYGTSDLTLKKDVVTITNSVDIIKKLVGRSFTWKEDNIKSFGVIAQEVETVLPELVSTSDEPEGSEIEPKKNVNYSAFTGHFIEAIKELATKIEALETEVAALKAS